MMQDRPRRTERVFRLTVIDNDGAASFISPGHGAKVLTAACSKSPANLAELLLTARPFDTDLVDHWLDGLAYFDEHNSQGHPEAIHRTLTETPPAELPPFRVVDAVTRTASVKPVLSGLILFNLPAQRIVQVHNSYSAIQRRDRGRIRASGRPTRHLYRYELPTEWSIVP